MKALWRRDCTTPPTMVVVTCKAMGFSLFVDLDTHLSRARVFTNCTLGRRSVITLCGPRTSLILLTRD
jgi:hypothetical protein